jgi:hypothetical protein
MLAVQLTAGEELYVVNAAQSPLSTESLRPSRPSLRNGDPAVTAQGCLARASRCLQEAGRAEEGSAFAAWIELAADWVNLAKQPAGERAPAARGIEAEEATLQRALNS